MSEMAIARVHPAFGDVRFGELSHQLEGGPLAPRGPRRRLDSWFFPFPMLPHLRPTDGLRSRWNAGVFGAGLPSACSLPHPPTLLM